MGIKITSLPVVSLPYSGSEQIALVQSGTTKVGNLSSLTGYLSGALLTDSELAALSSNWQNTYTTYRANSANYAVRNNTNNFTGSNTFNLDTTFSSGINFDANCRVYTINNSNLVAGFNSGSGAGDGGILVNNLILGNNAGNYFGFSGEANVSVIIGKDAGESAGYYGTINSAVMIGDGAGNSSGSYYGTINSAVMIGDGAGNSSGSSGGTTYSSIAVGRNAGAGAAIGGGVFSNSIAIGSFAGYNAAYYLGDVSSSIMIGYNAGYSAGGGARMTDCVLLGTGAGANSTAAGAVAENVIMIGSSAGSNSGNGFNISESIFIGLSSGVNQRGRRNTFIGSQTNTASTSAASLSGCIAIGHGARPSARNTIAIGSATTPLSVVPGQTFSGSLSGLRIMINGIYYTIPLLA
jgi:hypothetical protein